MTMTDDPWRLEVCTSAYIAIVRCREGGKYGSRVLKVYEKKLEPANSSFSGYSVLCATTTCPQAPRPSGKGLGNF